MYVYTIYAYTHMYPYYIYLYPYIFIRTYIHTIYIFIHTCTGSEWLKIFLFEEIRILLKMNNNMKRKCLD